MRYNVFMAKYHIQQCSPEDYAAVCTEVAQRTAEPVSFLQAPLYGQLQTVSGKTVIYYQITSEDGTVGCGLGVVYSAPGGLKFLYCPYGPICQTWDNDLIRALEAFFRPVASKLGCCFARIDSDGVKSTSVKRPIPSKLARTASLQPRAEWVLDVTADEETIWMGFHKHARYNVRLAERANATITILKPSEVPLETFYSLMKTTSERDGFGVFDRSYYQSYFETLSDEEGFVVLVTIDGKPAAVGLFVIYDQQAHYVFAGSSNDFRKIAPAYSVIWTAIKQTKKHGCTLFNFGGVTDDVKGHDLGGVTGFKTRFGGYRVEHANPIDFVYKTAHYALFKLYKTVR